MKPFWGFHVSLCKRASSLTKPHNSLIPRSKYKIRQNLHPVDPKPLQSRLFGHHLQLRWSTLVFLHLEFLNPPVPIPELSPTRSVESRIPCFNYLKPRTLNPKLRPQTLPAHLTSSTVHPTSPKTLKPKNPKTLRP